MSKKIEKEPVEAKGSEEIDPSLLSSSYKELLVAAEEEDKQNRVSPRDPHSKLAKLPSSKEFCAAVAKTILGHLENWPSAFTELLGDEHPSKDSFVNGVPYILRAYATIASHNAKKRLHDDSRKDELQAVGEIGPLATRIGKMRRSLQKSIELEILRLREQRGKLIVAETKRIKKDVDNAIEAERARLNNHTEINTLESSVALISLKHDVQKENRLSVLRRADDCIQTVRSTAERLESVEREVAKKTKKAKREAKEKAEGERSKVFKKKREGSEEQRQGV